MAFNAFIHSNSLAPTFLYIINVWMTNLLSLLSSIVRWYLKANIAPTKAAIRGIAIFSKKSVNVISKFINMCQTKSVVKNKSCCQCCNLSVMSFIGDAQRSRLCAGVGIEFRLLVNVSQIYRFKLMFYSFAQ